MSDLDGEEAFDRVLESAMESRSNANKERDQRLDAESRLRAVQTELDKALSRAETLQTQQQRALPKLAELWQAARDFSNLYGLNAEGMRAHSAERERLLAALAAAVDFYDEIPF